MNWKEQITASAHRYLQKRKWNKPLLLPFSEDVCYLHTYLKERACTLRAVLYTGTLNASAYRELSHVLLINVTLFKKQRSGKVQNECRKIQKMF